MRRLQLFGPREHGGRSQTFGVAEDARGVLFAGNLSGLLEYDGVRWRLHELPNESAVFGVAPGPGGRVFVGGWHELGLFAPDAAGELRYVSLTGLVRDDERPVGEVRAVHLVAGVACFRTERHLFLWDGTTLRGIPAGPLGAFRRSFVAGERLYLDTPAGLARLEEGGAKLLPEGARLDRGPVTALASLPGSRLVAIVEGRGLFVIDANGAVPVAPETGRRLATAVPRHAVTLLDGRIAVATRAAGVVVLGPDLAVEEEAGEAAGLPRAEPGGLAASRSGGLWLGLDTVLARLDLAAPITVFDTRTGLDTGVMAVLRHRGRLHAAGTGGVAVLDSGVRPPRFRVVPSLSAVAFGMAEVGDRLLVATAEGVFDVTDGEARCIPGTEGRRVYTVAPSLVPGRAFAGLKGGVLELEVGPSGGRVVGTVVSLDENVRTVLEEPEGTLWLGTTFKGVVRLVLRPLGEPETTVVGEPGEVEPFRIGGGLRFFHPRRGVLRLDPGGRRMIEDAALSGLAGARDAFRASVDPAGRVFVNSAPPLVAVPGPGGYRVDPDLLAQVPGRDVHSVYAEASGVVWVATEEGLFRCEERGVGPPRALLGPLVRRVVTGRGQVVYGGNGGPLVPSLPVVAAGEQRLRFECAAPAAGGRASFQYLLDGVDDAWSEPTTEADREYTNVSAGRHRFRVRVRVDSAGVSPEATFVLRITPRWFLHPAALLVWVGLASAAALGIVRLRERALRRRNRFLAAKVEGRTRELAEAVAALDLARSQLEVRNRDLADTNEGLRWLSSRDGLTGLANRRQLDETLRREWARATRSGAPLSMVLADVDCFKALNDALGHPEGDRALQAVAGVLSAGAARAGDVAARYGGEEFVLLLPGTDLPGAVHVAETLRLGVEAIGFPNPRAPLGHLTISFGVACAVPRDGGQAEDLVARADGALYDAKLAGRNRVASR